MPALPNVPNVLRVTTKVSDGADLNSINRFFIAYTGSPPTITDVSEFNVDISEAWTANMESLYSTSSVLEEIATEDLTDPSFSSSVDSFSVTGTRAGNALGAGTATVVQLGILRRYRGGHPRQYLASGIDTDLATRQTWQSAYLTAVATGYTNFQAAIKLAGWSGAGTLQHVNVSYFHGFTPFTFPSGRVRNIPKLRTGGPVVDAIATYAVNTHVASQRRRNLQSA